MQAAVDEADRPARPRRRTPCERLSFDVSTLEHEREEARRRVDVALAKLHESDATLAAVAEELGQFGSQARNAKAEAERLDQAIAAAEEARDSDLEGLAELEARLAAAEDAPEEEPDTTEREQPRRGVPRRPRGRDGGPARAAHRRGAGPGAARPRRLAAPGRPGRARGPRRQRSPAASGCSARARSPRRSAAASPSCSRGSRSRSPRPPPSAPRVEQAAPGREQELREARERAARPRPRARRAGQHGAPRRDGPHPAADADRAARGAGARGARPRRCEALVADYGPDQLVPLSLARGRARSPRASRRPSRCRSSARSSRSGCASAERALAQLGRVNPLALEEFSALEERHKFLTEQLEDLRSTRRDLLDIVREVDERVEQVFTEAYADVSAAFDGDFERLFPGGEGRLVLTDPDDMLNTGIEVEARPPGKKVKRLSLLSGGERSLVAVAFLVALFKARPSPFYILDEVEAALDDTNLGRLLEIYEELRENSQLLVITHQKRTMEVGDALYGVTMRGDGVSAVISQRLREAEPA